MRLPKISALCPTYGRTALLEESIECFFKQDYAGPKELIIFNDLPAQTLRFDDPNVCVVNSTQRCQDLAHKRNATAMLASGDLLMTWSDDDIHLPGRMRLNFEAYTAGSYVFENQHIFLNANDTPIMKQQGLSGPFLMAREDYFRLGGIPPAQTGEDQLFMAVVAQSGLEIKPSTGLSYIYRWGCTARYHASWFDKQPDAWEKCRQSVEDCISTGKEPPGDVRLQPRWRQNYAAIADAFTTTAP